MLVIVENLLVYVECCWSVRFVCYVVELVVFDKLKLLLLLLFMLYCVFGEIYMLGCNLINWVFWVLVSGIMWFEIGLVKLIGLLVLVVNWL